MLIWGCQDREEILGVAIRSPFADCRVQIEKKKKGGRGVWILDPICVDGIFKRQNGKRCGYNPAGEVTPYLTSYEEDVVLPGEW